MADTQEEKATAAEKKVGAKALAVHDKRGHFVREYSTEVHGEDFKKHAEGYAEKIGGSVQKAR